MTRKRIVTILGVIGVVAVTLVLSGGLHDGDTAEAQSVPASYTKVSMPDLGQHSTGWCWVAAAANSFWWYGENVARYEGLLGGAGMPWKAIDSASTTPASPCGVGGTWYDDRDGPPAPNDGSAVLGYATVLKKIAETTFRDADQDGIKDAGENNYCYGDSEGVEKWDYLIGLRDYVNSYGKGLRVHDIIDPARCPPGSGLIVKRTGPQAPLRSPCGPGGVGGVPGVDQVRLPPTFTDYKEELSRSQDVLLWMEPPTPTSPPETAHVVTGVGYTSAPSGTFFLGTITISDPWTHTTNPPLPPVPSAFHNDGLLPPWQTKPDHNTSDEHADLPGTDPYNLCDVTQVNPLKIQCYNEDPNPTPPPPYTTQVWNVVDMIFVSPDPVGGLAELPDLASDSGSSTGTYAALAGGLAAAVVILSAGAWYARRRWVR